VDLEQALEHLLLRLDAVVHHLQVVALGAEDVPVLARHAHGARQVAVEQGLGELALEAAREHDEALGVFGEQLPVDARVVVEALEEGLRGEGHQVLVALEVPGQDGDVAVVPLGAALLPARALGHVHLAADDGLEARLAAAQVELDGPVHVAVVGDGHALGALPGELQKQGGGGVLLAGDARHAVEEGVFGVVVQVDEVQVGVHEFSIIPA